VNHNKLFERVDKLLENQDDTDSKDKKINKIDILPVDEWIKKQNFKTTADLKVPELLLDQVIGQDKAVDIVRKASEQKRHVMLIGDPGTGKSMVARAMTAFLSKEELEDIIAYPNNDDSNTPHIRVVPGGKANEIVKSQREEAKKKKEQQGSFILSFAFIIIILSFFAAITPAFTETGFDYNKIQTMWIFLGFMAAFFIYIIF